MFTRPEHNPHSTAGLRAALYYRVSQPGQVEAFGYDAQKRDLPKHAARMGWTIAGHYEEPGISGDSLLTRPGIRRLLEDAQRGQFDVILVIEDTRLSRGELADWQYIKAVCDQHGVSLATPSGIFYRPNNEDDDFTTDIRGVMSKREKKAIQRRLMRGKREATAQGCLIQGTAPFGYRFARYGKKACEKRLEIVPEQAEVVRLIFQLVTHGDGTEGPFGTLKIAVHLNEVLRVPSPTSAKWAPRDGAAWERKGRDMWSTTTVRDLVRRAAYKGVWHYGSQLIDGAGTPEAIIPPIVSEDQWEAANRAMAQRNRNTMGRPSQRPHRPLLAGFLRCPHCGYTFLHFQTPYTTREGKEGLSRQYACNGRVSWRRFKVPKCENHRWNADLLEPAVWEEVRKIVQAPEMLRTIVEAAEEDAPKPTRTELPLLERSLAGVDEATERVKAAYRAGVYTLDELETELTKIRQERETLQQRLADMHAQVSARAEWERSVASAIDLCREYRTVIDQANETEKRGILQDLVEEVSVNRDGIITIRLVFGTTARSAVNSLAKVEGASKSCREYNKCKPLSLTLQRELASVRQ